MFLAVCVFLGEKSQMGSKGRSGRIGSLFSVQDTPSMRVGSYS